MSIYGTGVDLCEIARIEKSLQKHGDTFADKILHKQEKKHFAKHRSPARFLAKRFAAKEAFAKAMGTGIAQGITMPCIEVRNDDLGKPELTLHGKTLEKVEQLGKVQLHLSISDEKRYAIAQVIIERV